MSYKLIVVEKVIKWLVGGDLFTFVTETVEEMNSIDMSGEDKRLAVQRLTMEFFTKTSSVFINIAIEIAVLVLKAKLTK